MIVKKGFLLFVSVSCDFNFAFSLSISFSLGCGVNVFLLTFVWRANAALAFNNKPGICFLLRCLEIISVIRTLPALSRDRNGPMSKIICVSFYNGKLF